MLKGLRAKNGISGRAALHILSQPLSIIKGSSRVKISHRLTVSSRSLEAAPLKKKL